MLLVAFVPLALDPNATIRYNGVTTAAAGPKVSAVLFCSCFVVAGVGFLFAPSRYLDRLFIWRQSLWDAIAFWRR